MVQRNDAHSINYITNDSKQTTNRGWNEPNGNCWARLFKKINH